MTRNILVLTRNPALLLELRRMLGGEFNVLSCETIEQIASQDGRTFEAVLVHFHEETLNGVSAAHFIALLDEAAENVPMIGLLDDACPPRLHKLAMKTIDHCLEMPWNYDRLKSLLAKKQDIEGDLAGFWSGMPHKELHGLTRSLVTFTPEMFEMIDELKVAARHNVTMLLIGETGSGKTFLARLIHEISEQRNERFCTVACGALPPELIESELFGHVKGAFTGADRDREGKFAAAAGGTLLLDEIDVLSPEQQAKLLRVIETGEYEPVGSNETRHSDARLIVASNYNLEDLVKAGSFRTDLYYRLNILNFRLLPLRERPWDTEFLARRFALEHSRSHGITLRSIEPEFFDVLRRYPWPGNVREMENVIRRAVLYCQKGTLTLGDLPSSIRAAVLPQRSTTGLPPSYGTPIAPHYSGIQPGAPVLHPNLAFKNVLNATLPAAYPQANAYAASSYAAGQPSYAVASRSQIAAGYDQPPASVGENIDVTRTLEARVDVMERHIIEDCLRKNNHRRKETAAELGISRVTLYNKMKKFSLL